MTDQMTRPPRALSDYEAQLVALLRAGPTTTWDAFERLRCSCLRTEICRLKSKGVPIAQERFVFTGSHGKNVSAVRYWLRVEDEDGGACP